MLTNSARTFKVFLRVQPFQLAAALSFYTLLSLAPLLVFLVGAAGAIWGEEAAEGQLTREVERLLGPAGAEVLNDVIVSAHQPGEGQTALVVALVMTLFGASSAFSQLRACLDQVFGVSSKRNALWDYLRSRLLGALVVLLSGLIFIASTIGSAGLAAFADSQLGAELVAFAGTGIVWNLIELGISVVVMGLLVAIIFAILPDARLSLRDTVVGAGMTALLLGLGKFLFAFYLSNAGVGSAYGAAGSLVAVLTWIYYSALILLFGAAITRVHAEARGRLSPTDEAEPVEPTAP